MAKKKDKGRKSDFVWLDEPAAVDLLPSIDQPEASPLDRLAQELEPVPAPDIPAPAGLRQFLDRATGARLCFGDPLERGDRTVIPVAGVRAGGGWGGGHDPTGEGSGGGGGGGIRAVPMGFLEITPEGTRFQRIVDPTAVARTAIGAALAGFAAAALLRRGGR